MGKITFILGGARSGKSRHAVQLAERSGRGTVIYIATGEARDAEMKKRIALHKRSRPGAWETFEEPLRVSMLLERLEARRGVILVDCLTLLVSNLMLKKTSQEAIEEEIAAIVAKLRSMKTSAIIVSNEVGLGIVPLNRLARDFRDIAGSVNRIAAEMSDEVIFMVSGIPWKIK